MRLVRVRPSPKAASPEPDEGMAFIVVVAIIALVMAVLAATLFRVALDNITVSQRTVVQGQALQAAEAAVDLAYQGIEALTMQSSTSSLHHVPCGPVSGNLGSAPSSSTYSATIKYYKYATAAHPTPTVVTTATCSTTPFKLVRIVITATGTDLGQTALVKSQANIAPVNPFSNSVFVNGNMTLRGSNSSLGGQTVYVHTGNLTCNGGGTIYGSVTVFGKLTAGGTCSIAGAVEATTSISIGGNATIGGTVISTTGSITVTGSSPTVSGSMYARGTITISSTAWYKAFISTHTVTGIKVNYSVNPTETALARPVKEPWPDLTWAIVKWSTMHYKTVTAGATCTKAKTAVLAAKSAPATGYVGIALNTSCQIKFTKITKSLVLAQSLAVFSSAGITMSSNASVTDSSSTKHTLMLVVPTGTSCGSKTTNGGISIHGSVGTGLQTLIYSPCTVSIQGSSPLKQGKIYAKSLSMNGNMTLGTSNFTIIGMTSTQVSVGIDFERQIS